MLSRKITEDDRKKMIQYREMLFSPDDESVRLGMALAKEEFGKYRLWNHDKSLTLQQAANMNEDWTHHVNISGVGYWLYFAARQGKELFYE